MECSEFTATEFGSSDYNGVYTLAGTNNGLPSYENSNAKWVYWQMSNNWLMSPTEGADEGHYYYGAGNDTTTPETVTWAVSGGAGPAGTFTCTEVPVVPYNPATTTEAYLGSIAFGQAIIITLMSLGLIGYVYNKITAKKPWL